MRGCSSNGVKLSDKNAARLSQKTRGNLSDVETLEVIVEWHAPDGLHTPPEQTVKQRVRQSVLGRKRQFAFLEVDAQNSIQWKSREWVIKSPRTSRVGR